MTSTAAPSSESGQRDPVLSIQKKFVVASVMLVLAVGAGGVLLYVGGTSGAALAPAAVAGGGLLALSLVLFVAFAYRSVSQITSLSESVTAVSRGDLDREVTVDRSDELGQLSASVDELRTALKERAAGADAGGDAAVDAAETADRNDTEELEARAREFGEIAARCADGDFTRRMDADGENEVMNEVAGQFNRMMTEIEETVVDLQDFAQIVASASEDVNGAAQDVRASSQEVADSVREVITTTEDSLDAVSGEMEGLSTMTEQIASSSNQVAQLSRRTSERGREGREAAQSAIYGMSEIREQSDEAVEEIDALRSEMEQIDELLDFITSIAERTNMLALNANIEASRGSGGGDSEGFGVVAEEIRELADDTKDTAGEIEDRLEQIQAQTDATAEKVEATREEVEAHADAVENAIEALDEIAEYAEETNTGIQEINAATEQQAAAAQEVVAIVDDTQSTIDETVSEARNVVDAAENQARVLDSVADNTAELSDQARWLDDTLSMFRVSSEVEAAQRIGDTTDDIGAVEAASATGEAASEAGGSAAGAAPEPAPEPDPAAPSAAASTSTSASAGAAGGSDSTPEPDPATGNGAAAASAPGDGETGATPAPATASGARTHFATGHGAGDDGRRVGAAAAEQAMGDLGADHADFCQVFVSPEYDYGEVLGGIRDIVGEETRIVGCSTSGEFTQRAAEEGSVALALVTSEDMDFHVGVGEHLSEDVTSAVEGALAQMPDSLDRPHVAAINLHDGLAGAGDRIALVTQRKLGRQVSCAGGSAADNLQMEETVVFVGDEDGDRVVTDGVAMALIGSEQPITVSVDHGNEPISEVYTVTRAEGGTVHELDGRPAFEVWKDAVRERAREELGIDVDAVEPGTEEWATMFGLFEFGVVSDRSERALDHRVRWPGLTETADGPMDFAVQIPEGEELRVMFSAKDKQIESATAVARTAVDGVGGDLAGAFVYDCACRSMILGEDFDQAVDALGEQLDAPFVGLETYGELCMQQGESSGFHNTTSVVMALPSGVGGDAAATAGTADLDSTPTNGHAEPATNGHAEPATNGTSAPAASGDGAAATPAPATDAGMRTYFATGHAAGDGEDGERVGASAAEQAMGDLGADHADFCQVFVSPEYDYGEVLAGIREVVGDDTRLIGCSTSGEFTQRAAEEKSVALSLVTSEDMDFHVGLGEGLSKNVTGAVDDAISGFPADVDRPHLAAINLHDGLAGVGNQIALVTQRKLGREVSTAGGSAADDLQMQETKVFVGDEDGDRVATDALAMALIASEEPVIASVDHGHEPISETFTVTEAEGGTVHELDGRPAFEVYKDAIREHAMETLEMDVDSVEPGTEEWATMTGLFEFGIVSESGGDIDNRVRWPGLTESTEGPMDFAVQIPEGEDVRVMFGDRQQQIEAAARVAGDAVARAGESTPAGAFVYECACRSMILGEDFDQAVDALDAELGVPFVGLETYGELCMQQGESSGFHNTTSVVMLLPGGAGTESAGDARASTPATGSEPETRPSGASSSSPEPEPEPAQPDPAPDTEPAGDTGTDADAGQDSRAATSAPAGGSTHFATGHAAGSTDESEQVGAAAATQALDDLGADHADFCQVFVSPSYDYDEVLGGVREVVGDDTRLIGCSTSGEFTEKAAKEGSVALSLVTSEDMDFHVGLGEGLSKNVTGAVEDAISGFPADVDRPHLAAINLHDGLAGVGNQIALVTQRKLGREVSTAGGSAADDLQMQETKVFVGDEDGDRVASDALAMCLIASEEPVIASVDHGHEPISETFTVTKAEGGTVHELDGRPAFEVYREVIREPAMEKLGIDVDAVEPGTEEWATMTGLFEFGIVSESGGDIDNRVRWPGLTETTEGPLDFAVQIPEGEDVRVMFGDRQQQIEAAARVAGDAIERSGGRQSAGAFVYECACRSMILGDDFDQAVDALGSELGVPFVGLETYGELCMQQGEDSGYHNTTSVVMLLPA